MAASAVCSAVKIGIIGGTGLDDPEILEGRTEKHIDTPYGKPSDALISGKIKNIDCVLLSRHGRHHSIMPTNINFRANMWALKEEGCTHLLVTTACGSLREEIQPGDLVIIDQFIDWTRKRHLTFYDGTNSCLPGVCHVSMAEPFCTKTREVSVDRVLKTLKENANKATSLLLTAIPQIGSMEWSETHQNLKNTVQLSVMLPKH
ncbi:S-methyl-5'-thioadenosine phosphorylase isoform X2 [Notechis scutatus]|uniref:S-methyl-5'-thioadenosine phosphorylase isoform X2 n=1 Tax=Notechis scutatus TaxID=8663 RepID=A0A6J1UCH7_9SAUR|nr:S-methyl-5'-thioadenosine phosphorylase isoform X2 [Notechis scutatus]